MAGNDVKSAIIPNHELVEELKKSIIRTFENQKVNSYFKDNILGADLVYTLLLSKYIKETRFLLGGIGIYSKYAWIASLKDKEDIISTNAFK